MFHGQVAEISNREDLELLYEAIDEDTGESIDLTGASIVARISGLDLCHPRINASTDDGKITLVESGVFRLFISRDEIGSLCPQTYEIGVTIENAGITYSLIVGTLAVIDGVVGR